MLRRALILATIPLLSCAGPAGATPPPRYASPSGTSAQDCAAPATACDIATAIDGDGLNNNPVAGQEIIVEPGTYTLTATLAPSVNTTIHGVAGRPRPVIRASGFPVLYPSGAFALHISYLEFDVTVPGNDGINTSGAVFDQVLIKGSANGGNVCQCYDGTMRNSIIVNTGPTGGAWGVNSNGGTASETLRNDTFVATQAAAYAMFLQQDQAAPSGPMTADAKNVIALNTANGHDVYAYGAQVTITMAYSDYSNPLQANTGVVTNAGHNISTAPAFIDQAAGNYGERIASPTVDAGTDDTADDGIIDYAGGPRMTGAHTDIGAVEYEPPAAITATGGTPQSAAVTTTFAQPLSARVTDVAGNPVFGVAVTFTTPGSPSATFGGATAAHVTTGEDGTAAVPAPSAGTRAGTYAVTATAAGVSTGASLALTNLPGPAASLALTPSTRTVPAGVAQSYSVEALDAYGNDAGSAGAGVQLRIAPDGSCAGLSCSALIPRAHTVTATRGAVTGTAALTVSAVAPRLGLRTTALRIAHRRRRGGLSVSCTALRGETCTVTGTVKARFRKHRLTLGTISGRVLAGTRGTLKLALTKSAVRTLRGHTVNVSAQLTVVDLSGRATVPVRFSLRVR